MKINCELLEGRTAKYSMNTKSYSDWFLGLNKGNNNYYFLVDPWRENSVIDNEFKDILTYEHTTVEFDDNLDDYVKTHHIELNAKCHDHELIFEVSVENTDVDKRFCGSVYGITIVGIIGLDFLQYYGFHIDFDDDEIWVEDSNFDKRYIRRIDRERSLNNIPIIHEIIEKLIKDYKNKAFGKLYATMAKDEDIVSLNSIVYEWNDDTLFANIDNLISSDKEKDYFCVLNWYPKSRIIEYGIFENNDTEKHRSHCSQILKSLEEELASKDYTQEIKIDKKEDDDLPF